jgi:hypothetical protein
MSKIVIMEGKEVDLEEYYKEGIKKKKYTKNDIKRIEELAQKALVKIKTDSRLGPEYNNIYLIKIFALFFYGMYQGDNQDKTVQKMVDDISKEKPDNQDKTVQEIVDNIIKEKPLGDSESTSEDQSGLTLPQQLEKQRAEAQKEFCAACEEGKPKDDGRHEYLVYPYKDKMYTPGDLAMSSDGDHLSSNMNSLKSFLRLLWQGGGRASKLTGDQIAWGNKFFQKTDSTCTALDGDDKGKDVGRWIYNDNVPTGISKSSGGSQALTCQKIWNDNKGINEPECKDACKKANSICTCLRFKGKSTELFGKDWDSSVFTKVPPLVKCPGSGSSADDEAASGPAVGLLPSMTEDIEKLIPKNLFNYDSYKSSTCKKVTLKTRHNVSADLKKDSTGKETHYITLADIEEINPCNFISGVNSETNKSCSVSESFSKIKSDIPNDILFHIYIGALSLLGMYILKKSMDKKR